MIGFLVENTRGWGNAAVSQPVVYNWSTSFGVPGVNGEVGEALAHGDSLIVAGGFSEAGGTVAHNTAIFTPIRTEMAGRQSPVIMKSNVPLKDPTTAGFLSFLIVGGGQIYAGEVEKGLGMLTAATGAVMIGMISSKAMERQDCKYVITGIIDGVDYGYERCITTWSTLTPVYVGSAIAAVVWLTGIIDAPKAVKRYNEKAIRTHIRPVAYFDSGKVRSGVSLSMRL